MEHSRTDFLNIVLGERIPREVVSIIRDYDPIYRDYFSKNVVSSLSDMVNDFWYEKLNKYINRPERFGDPNFGTKLHFYCNMIFDAVCIPKKFEGGLFIVD